MGEPREHSSTNPSSGHHHHQDTLVFWPQPPGEAPRDTTSLARSLLAWTAWRSDTDVRSQAELQASALQLRKGQNHRRWRSRRKCPRANKRRPSKRDQLNQRKHRCNLHRLRMDVEWIVNYTALWSQCRFSDLDQPHVGFGSGWQESIPWAKSLMSQLTLKGVCQMLIITYHYNCHLH